MEAKAMRKAKTSAREASGKGFFPNTQVVNLVGRCFHIFDKDGCVQYQGIVRGDLGGGHYLVQYFEWVMGEASTMEIRTIEEMTVKLGTKRQCDGYWQFYEDNEHMNFWYEHHAPKRN